MNAERHALVSEVFLRALDLSQRERADYLEQACGSDADLRREVETLLARDARPARLDTPLASTRVRDWIADSDQPDLPASIGPYAILDLLGRGGMGTVYRARQTQPPRDVALKVLSGAHVTPDALRRFEFEAAVLGRLTHPGIAQIFEADLLSAAGGRVPYFAMELIVGRPLTQYAAERDLSVRARLGLLVQVCAAVAYAHQKGVIHRDLKPANILVSEAGAAGGSDEATVRSDEATERRSDDGKKDRAARGAATRPIVKILDFGVARSVDGDLAQTQHTTAGQLVGTLAYMSPEQLHGDPAQVDTQSDVYALGVIAFELLAGRPPVDLTSRSVTECLDLLRNGPPARLGAVRPDLRGDVETIVAKAMARDRRERYESAGALAEDIQRYLRDEPILARPPSLAHKIRLFTRRNRALVLGATGLVASLMIGIAATTWQSVRATRSEARANDLALSETAARRSAEAEALKATEIRDFLQSLLVAAAPQAGRGADFTVRQALDEAAGRIETEFADYPEVRMELLLTIGDGYRGLGLCQQAAPHLRRGLALCEQLRSPDHADLIRPLWMLGVVLRDCGEAVEADRTLSRAIALCTQHGRTETDLYRKILTALGHVQRRLGETERARQIADEAIAAGPQDVTAPGGVNAMFRKAAREALRKNWPAAEATYRAILEHVEREEREGFHAAHASALEMLARSLHRQHRCAEAIPLFEQALERQRHALGEDGPPLPMLQSRFALCLIDVGRTDDAEALAQATLHAISQPRPDEPPILLAACEMLAAVFERLQRPEQFEAVLRRAQQIAAGLPPEANGLQCAILLAQHLAATGREAEGEQVLAECVRLVQTGPLENHPMAQACRRAWGQALASAGRRAEGEAQFQDVYDRLLAVHGQDDPRTIRAASELAEFREHGFVAAGRDRPELMQRD